MARNRKDGNYIKQFDGIHKIVPYIYNKRTESEVHAYKTIDITKLYNYLENKNKDVSDKRLRINLFHAILVASGRLVYNRPLLNRFVQGKNFYQRNKVVFSFVAKNKFSDSAEERFILLDINKNDNIDSISSRILKDVQKVRTDGTNQIDTLLNSVCRIPRSLLSFFVNLVKRWDYYGINPETFTKGDINYSTILFSNLGSIKCDAIYHHLNNYGTNSIVITIGTIKDENFINNDGKIGQRKTVTLGITIDERIADGFYFAKSTKILDYLFDHPEMLEEPVGNEVFLDELS